MNNDFFEETKDIRDRLKKKLDEMIDYVKDNRIKDILNQRHRSSFFVKGISAYLIHKGLNGKLSEQKLLTLAASIELYSTSLVILDNIVDNHDIRNHETTYLREYGKGINSIAMQYATNISLFNLSSYIAAVRKCTWDLSLRAIGKAIDGMLSLDLDKPQNTKDIKNSILKVNGITLAAPLSLVASIATKNPFKIKEIFRYGCHTGLAFGLYEEIRDLTGTHGRMRGFELLRGRTPYFLALSKQKGLKIDLPANNLEGDYDYFVDQLNNTGVLEETESLVKKHLEKGSKALRRCIKSDEFMRLNKLKKTIEFSLEKLV